MFLGPGVQGQFEVWKQVLTYQMPPPSWTTIPEEKFLSSHHHAGSWSENTSTPPNTHKKIDR